MRARKVRLTHVYLMKSGHIGTSAVALAAEKQWRKTR